MLYFRSQILFHQVSQIGLNRGLYLCYVQARSSMEEGMRVIVSNTGPGILPYVKVRDNPHVTSDEWRWITLLGSRHKSSFIARQGMQKTIFHQTTYFFTTVQILQRWQWCQKGSIMGFKSHSFELFRLPCACLQKEFDEKFIPQFMGKHVTTFVLLHATEFQMNFDLTEIFCVNFRINGK